MRKKIIKSIIKLIEEFEKNRDMNGGADTLLEFLDWLKIKYFE